MGFRVIRTISKSEFAQVSNCFTDVLVFFARCSQQGAMYHLSSRPKPCRGWKASYKLFFRKSKLRLWSFQLAQWARMWQRHGYLLPPTLASARVVRYKAGAEWL